MKNRKLFGHAVYLLIICCSSIPGLTLAASGFRVLNVTGSCSLINDNNESKPLTKGVYLPTNTKIIIAKGGQLTMQSDASDVYHLSESSTMEVWRQQMVLLQGTLWVQSPNEERDRQVETVNSVVEYKKSEFVLSFDEVNKKTQVFVISGHASIANIFMRSKKELLVSGEISYIQKDFQQGMPRRPALIGQESLAAVFSKFKGIKPGDENFQNILGEQPGQNQDAAVALSGTTGATRSVASVSEDTGSKGIVFIPKNFSAPKRFHPTKARVKREIASYQSVDKQLKNKGANAPVRVYDFSPGKKASTWSSLLGGEDSRVSQSVFVAEPPMNNPMPSRSLSSVESSDKMPQKKVEVKKDALDDADFDSMMKELRGVSSQHNEVY